MPKVRFETFLRFIRNQTYRFSYSCIFNLQFNIVSVINISLFASNLIRIKSTFYIFSSFPFIVAMEISVFLKSYHTKLQSKTSNWSKFHIDPSLGSLLNGQTKKLGMARKKTVLNINCGLRELRLNSSQKL